MLKKEIIKQVAMIMTIPEYAKLLEDYKSEPSYQKTLPTDRKDNLAMDALRAYEENYIAVCRNFDTYINAYIDQDFYDLAILEKNQE